MLFNFYITEFILKRNILSLWTPITLALPMYVFV